MKRPDYVHCIALDVGEYSPDYGKTWCGRGPVYRYNKISVENALKTLPVGGKISSTSQGPMVLRAEYSEWVFTDVAHALLEARSEGRLLVCTECSAAVAETLQNGTWKPRKNKSA